MRVAAKKKKKKKKKKTTMTNSFSKQALNAQATVHCQLILDPFRLARIIRNLTLNEYTLVI
jgi:hypothetical protein